jgi:hypothetical protein
MAKENLHSLRIGTQTASNNRNYARDNDEMLLCGEQSINSYKINLRVCNKSKYAHNEEKKTHSSRACIMTLVEAFQFEAFLLLNLAALDRGTTRVFFFLFSAPLSRRVSFCVINRTIEKKMYDEIRKKLKPREEESCCKASYDCITITLIMAAPAMAPMHWEQM